jgi:hypothetical protein
MDLEKLRRFLTPGVLLSALGIGVVLIGGVVYLLFWYTPAQATEAPEAALTWIPGPTNTPVPPTATLLPTSTVTPTFTPSETGEIGIGVFVQITGTDGAGLNIRNEPGLATNINFLGYDAEVFEVRDGPREADGLTWWYVVTPVDDSRAGWAASNYLTIVANP